MPNPTIPAAGEAMPAARQSRRRFLAGAVALPAFAMSASAFMAGAVADPVFAAIEDHRRLFAYANEPGVSDEETDRRVDLEAAAMRALVNKEPTTLKGVRTLLEYVSDYENGCELEPELFCSSIKSVAAALKKMEATNG